MNEMQALVLVRERLEALRFPFSGGEGEQVGWCRDGLASGLLERTAVSEKFAHGTPVAEIARACGISELRVYHHLSRGPGMQTAEAEEWRLVYEDEAA